MKILYFAWLRERLNRGEEEVTPPAEIVTVADLLDWLGACDEAAELAFADRAAVKAALDEEIVPLDTPLGDARTLALFPPMTGG
ncbi:MAG: MoaD/ThiS family protein [Alphaproteobacteria bacterium]|nr:MoaD/ThiS family protein [Alphaproteobacteria bacterium]